MKLLHTLFAGAVALLLLGVTATTLPADDDRFSEAIKDNEEVQNQPSAFRNVDAPSASVADCIATDDDIDDTATTDDTDDGIDLPPASAAQPVCPFVYVQHLYNPEQWEVANEPSAFRNVDAPSASVAASTATDKDTATTDDTDEAIDLPPASAAQPVCPFVYVQHMYNPEQWEVAQVQDEPSHSPTDKLDAIQDAPTTAVILHDSPGSPAQCVPRHYGWWISNVDVCSDDRTDHDDTIDKTDGDATDPDGASTGGGGEEALHDNGPTTEASDEIIGDNGPPISTEGEGVGSMPTDSSVAENDVAPVGLEGQHDNDPTTDTTETMIGANDPPILTEGEAVGSMPTNSSVAENDVAPVGLEGRHDNDPTTDTTETVIGDNDPPISTEGEGVGSMPTNSSVAENDVAPVGLESTLRLQMPAGRDPSVRVVLSEGSDVEPPTLTLFELDTDQTTGLTPTEVVQLTAGVQVRTISRVAFKIFKGKESWIFNAHDREERDIWTDALVHAIDEAATFDGGDMASAKGSATSLSGILSQNKGLFTQRWKLTLTGSVLNACKRGTSVRKVVQLTADVQVQAVSLVAWRVFKGKESWAFTARDREERDLWINALLHAMDEAAMPDDGDMASVKGSATSPSDVIDLKTRRGMKPRRVTLTGPVLTTCKLAKTGIVTGACENWRLNAMSDAVHVNDENGGKGSTRFLFRVTEHSFPTARSWTFDAGSADERAKWVATIKAAADGTETEGGEGDAEEEATASPTPSSMYPPSKGWLLGPKDEPLFTGEYMSNLLDDNPTTLEVTELGDVLLSPGLFPDRAQEPLWAHRMTGTFDGRAIGGLGCALEDVLQRLRSRDAIPVTLSVKNGRWRVGRGMLCTLGRSPAPKGSLRRFLPWDERGREVREGSLLLLGDGSVVIAVGRTLLWDSLTAA